MPMKILRSKKMKSLLARGKRLARKKRRPGDGMLCPLFREESSNGWAYMVDWINDSRFAPKPWIEVFAFSPKTRQLPGAYSASHSLRSDND